MYTYTVKDYINHLENSLPDFLWALNISDVNHKSLIDNHAEELPSVVEDVKKLGVKAHPLFIADVYVLSFSGKFSEEIKECGGRNTWLVKHMKEFSPALTLSKQKEFKERRMALFSSIGSKELDERIRISRKVYRLLDDVELKWVLDLDIVREPEYFASVDNLRKVSLELKEHFDKLEETRKRKFEDQGMISKYIFGETIKLSILKDIRKVKSYLSQWEELLKQEGVSVIEKPEDWWRK